MNHLGLARTYLATKRPHKAREHVVAALRDSFVNAPAIGLDLDGTLDQAPEFFRVLTAIWPGKVYVITYRSNRDQAIACLATLGMRYDELILVSTFAAKADIVKEKGIGLFIDDMDEVLQHVPLSVPVMKMRNGENCDDDGRWVYDDKTGRPVR